jgi:hypothetical protein
MTVAMADDLLRAEAELAHQDLGVLAVGGRGAQWADGSFIELRR